MKRTINFNSSTVTGNNVVRVSFSFLGLAISLWIMDKLGIERWVAETIGDFISMIAAKV